MASSSSSRTSTSSAGAPPPPDPVHGRRKVYSAEFKHDALRLADDVGAKNAAQRLGIDRSLISNWRKARKKDGDVAFRGHGVMTAEAAELARLRRENAQLKLEREILKKATEFFMKEQA